MSLENPYCQRLRLKFDEFHDGDVSFFLKKVVARHLKDCENCREEYSLLVQTIQAVRDKPAPDIPPRVLKQLIESLSGPKGGSTQPESLPGLDCAQGLEPT